MVSSSKVWILVLGTADWQQAIATNQHYMTAELLKEFEVTFVNSIGLRRPTLSLRDLGRIWRRLVHSGNHGQSSRPVPHGLQIVSPLVIPYHRGILSIPNRWLLKRSVGSWVRASGEKVLWTYSPVTYGLEKFADGVLYHCVDLLAEFPGIDKKVISRAEHGLSRSGVTAAGSSKVVVEHLRNRGFRDPLYWPNVADTQAIIEACKSKTKVRRERSPSAFFMGNITSKKIDFKLLEGLLDAKVQLHLAGPVAEGGGNADQSLAALIANGAIYHGVLSLSQLAPIMASCTVGVIPYALNAYTNGVSPLKTFEYLAAGLSVVSTRLPGVDSLESHVHVADRGDFVDAVRERLAVVGCDVVSERIRVATAHSWSQRGQEAREFVRSMTGRDSNALRGSNNAE